MMPDRRAEIARRAYLLWEHEGRPQDKALDHWLRAESEIDAQASAEPVAPKVSPAAAKRPAKRKGRS